MSCRIIGTTNEVVEGNVIKISEGDHNGNCRNDFSVFVRLKNPHGNAASLSSIFLGYSLEFAKAFKRIRKWHVNTSKVNAVPDHRNDQRGSRGKRQSNRRGAKARKVVEEPFEAGKTPVFASKSTLIGVSFASQARFTLLSFQKYSAESIMISPLLLFFKRLQCGITNESST